MTKRYFTKRIVVHKKGIRSVFEEVKTTIKNARHYTAEEVLHEKIQWPETVVIRGLQDQEKP